MDTPAGNEPDCIEYSRSPCNGSKSSTSILTTNALSCLNVPRSEPVLNTGLLLALRSMVSGDPSISDVSIVIAVFDTLQKSAEYTKMELFCSTKLVPSDTRTMKSKFLLMLLDVTVLSYTTSS